MSDLKAPIHRNSGNVPRKQPIKQIKPSHMNQGNQTFYPGRQTGQPANQGSGQQQPPRKES